MRRSQEALQMYNQGVAISEIAEKMQITQKTVSNYVLGEKNYDKWRCYARNYSKKHPEHRPPLEYFRNYMRLYMKKRLQDPDFRKHYNAYQKKYQEKHRTNRIIKKGDKCVLCGYNKNRAALEVHHSKNGAKILICSNCHREVHYPRLTI